MLDTLVAAQAASGTDVVTAAVAPAGGAEIQLFLGNPGALGLVENQYGVVGLVRSSLAVAGDVPDAAVDPDWPLYARLALSGASVVSVPEVLSEHAGKPGSVEDLPGEGLRVLETFEQNTDAGDLAQLASTLAAARAQVTHRIAPGEAPSRRRTGLFRRLLARR
jgi:hypothetical protein